MLAYVQYLQPLDFSALKWIELYSHAFVCQETARKDFKESLDQMSSNVDQQGELISSLQESMAANALSNRQAENGPTTIELKQRLDEIDESIWDDHEAVETRLGQIEVRNNRVLCGG